MLINDFTYYINKFKIQNNYQSKTAGLDHPEKTACTAEEWRNYPIQDFDYQFNSWGFRGPEYDEHIGKPVNICLGDSFTVNFGGPIDHSWPSILSEHFDIPTLNLSMDRAGNDAIRIIYERACSIFDVQDTFVMCSDLDRRLDENFCVIQENDKLRNHIKYFMKQRISNVYEAALPSWCWLHIERSFLEHIGIFSYSSKDNSKVIKEERNRDGHHMSRSINKIYADYFYNKWKNSNDL